MYLTCCSLSSEYHKGKEHWTSNQYMEKHIPYQATSCLSVHTMSHSVTTNAYFMNSS